MDKGLSLRLGRASTIQDWDVTIPLPESSPGDHASDQALVPLLALGVKIARCQGNIHELLYSSTSLALSEQVRHSRVQILESQLGEVGEEIKSLNVGVLTGPQPERPTLTFGHVGTNGEVEHERSSQRFERTISSFIRYRPHVASDFGLSSCPTPRNVLTLQWAVHGEGPGYPRATPRLFGADKEGHRTCPRQCIQVSSN